MPALAYTEAPILAEKVAAGALPSLDQRLPASPRQLTYDDGKEIGRYGGTLNMLMGRPKDTRMMVVYGYTRLVGYDPEWRLVPDVLESVDVDDERVFTLHLRKGHRWSDGQPFTTEDFRYYWEDVLNNEELSHGFPRYLQVDGKPPVFDIIDETTVRYSLGQAQSVLPPEPGRGAAGIHLHARALHEAVPCRPYRRRDAPLADRGRGPTRLDRAPFPDGPPVPKRQSRPPFVAALGAEDGAAVHPLRVRAQSRISTASIRRVGNSRISTRWRCPSSTPS